MLKVKRFVNNPVPSSCYIIYDVEKSNSCILIDPATEDSKELFEFLNQSNLSPDYIILTHEHFDHCLSVNCIRERFPKIKLVCSKECNRAIQDEKKNCSVFWDNKKSFVIQAAEIISESFEGNMLWQDYSVSFLSTPGHTPGSISIMIGKFFFTGDAYIPGLKTVTKLPGGDKSQAIESIEKIKSIILNCKLIICPGHGDLISYLEISNGL